MYRFSEKKWQIKRPHTSLVTCQKLVELGYGVLAHPSYSPNLAPTDYHLFLSIQNSLAENLLPLTTL